MFDEERLVVGPFAVDPTGGLVPRDGDLPPCFSFAWRDRRVEARLVEDVLHLRAWVGRVPSTALHVPRVPAFEALRGLKRALPADWRVEVEASHSVRIEISTRLEGRLTAAALMTAVTRLMLELGPYLDLLEEAGVGWGDTYTSRPRF